MFTQKKNKVERAISEIRRGIPVMVYSKDGYLLFSSAEILERELFYQFKNISNNTYITLTANKIKYISKGKEDKNKRLLINNFDEIMPFINQKQDNLENCIIECSKEIDEYAISLLKLSELLPYALVVDIAFEDIGKMHHWCKENDIISVDASLINEFQHDNSVYEICRTPLFLKQNQDANIISYRTYNGHKEHHAIIFGDLNANEPLVRIHSSCYTGDLLDSLSCDCRSQLHQAIQMISNAKNGIILYLMQDGRGMGLTNKLKAYSMQRKYGLDTVDANRILGFNDDERDFAVAVEMLKKLNVKKLQLLTNNNKKLSELENYGIEVTNCVPLIVEYNKYNYSYMKTKCDKLGHKLMIF
ncbi:MAG: GTP cyclohydrolase II [Wolbachia endosymbiont of Tyrophagus putrescentiae]|nr:GTP cyclohydrolase II [Wolbachia endosymbiont of Tyrophagus putrescentiae]